MPTHMFMRHTYISGHNFRPTEARFSTKGPGQGRCKHAGSCDTNISGHNFRPTEARISTKGPGQRRCRHTCACGTHISGHNFRPTEARFCTEGLGHASRGRKLMPTGHFTHAALVTRIERTKVYAHWSLRPRRAGHTHREDESLCPLVTSPTQLWPHASRGRKFVPADV